MLLQNKIMWKHFQDPAFNDFIIYVVKNKLKTNNVQCSDFIAQVPNLSWLLD